jgi:hypothetical protein
MTEKMKVKVLTETTDWEFPNHTYFINPVSKRLVAYMKKDTNELIRFKGKGLLFDRSRRKFDVSWKYI